MAYSIYGLPRDKLCFDFRFAQPENQVTIKDRSGFGGKYRHLNVF